MLLSSLFIFITVKRASSSVFGEVVEGMDVVYKIENVSKGANDKPDVDVVIEDCGIISMYTKP